MKKNLNGFILAIILVATPGHVFANPINNNSDKEIISLVKKAEEAYRIQDHKSSLKWYLAAAKKGSSHAQNKLGNFYLIGLNGVRKDYKKAREHYEMAIGSGHIRAITSLGFMYEKGRGVRADAPTVII